MSITRSTPIQYSLRSAPCRVLSMGGIAIVLFVFTGCVGPMAHGPLGGCCGPAVGSNCNSCDGCGELYVDPWVNHPADCVDPCDMCGNYNGQSCGKCRPMFDGIWSLWGYRCGNDCGDCGDAGCDIPVSGGFLGGGHSGCSCGAEICGPSVSCDGACGGGPACGCETIGSPTCGCELRGAPSCGCEVGGPSCGMEVSGSACGCGACSGGEVVMGHNNGQIIHGGEYIVDGVPTPVNEQVISGPGNQPTKPERSRKIFNPRPRVATGSGRSVGY